MIVRLCRLVACCLCCLIAGSSAGWAQESHLDAPGEIPKYVRDPIPLYTTGLGPFHRPISSQERRSAGLLRPGLPDDVRVRAARRHPLVPRSVEARPRVRDLLLGRGLGVGLVPERPDVRRPVAVRVCGHAEGDQPEGQGDAGRARVHRRARASRYVKDFEAETRKEQDQAYADAMDKVAAQYPNDLDAITLYADALFLLEPRRGTRDVNAPNIKRLHGVLESALNKDPKHPGACHLYVHATESTVRARARGGVRRVSRQDHSRRQPHQPHAVAHLERSRAAGAIRCAPTSRPGIRT